MVWGLIDEAWDQRLRRCRGRETAVDSVATVAIQRFFGQYCLVLCQMNSTIPVEVTLRLYEEQMISELLHVIAEPPQIASAIPLEIGAVAFVF